MRCFALGETYSFEVHNSRGRATSAQRRRQHRTLAKKCNILMARTFPHSRRQRVNRLADFRAARLIGESRATDYYAPAVNVTLPASESMRGQRGIQVPLNWCPPHPTYCLDGGQFVASFCLFVLFCIVSHERTSKRSPTYTYVSIRMLINAFVIQRFDARGSITHT